MAFSLATLREGDMIMGAGTGITRTVVRHDGAFAIRYGDGSIGLDRALLYLAAFPDTRIEPRWPSQLRVPEGM